MLPKSFRAHKINLEVLYVEIFDSTPKKTILLLNPMYRIVKFGRKITSFLPRNKFIYKCILWLQKHTQCLKNYIVLEFLAGEQVEMATMPLLLLICKAMLLANDILWASNGGGHGKQLHS